MRNPERPPFDPQPEQREKGIDQLQTRLREISEKIVDNPVLDAIEQGELSQDQWREFAQQRYLAAKHFEDLLESAQQKVIEMGDNDLAEALASNLRDEKGVDAEGRPLPTGSHEKWRQDFYHALGLDEDALHNAKPLPGTESYDQTLKQLMQNESALTTAGALLIQEYSIPEEFKRIKTGRDLTFPDQFVIQPGDETEVRRQKGFARLYIDHHIAHDAGAHYPDLEKAIAKYADDPGQLSELLKGMDIISGAKQAFYKSLEIVTAETENNH